MTVNDGLHTQLGPENAGGSVTQTEADQDWNKVDIRFTTCQRFLNSEYRFRKVTNHDLKKKSK